METMTMEEQAREVWMKFNRSFKAVFFRAGELVTVMFDSDRYHVLADDAEAELVGVYTNSCPLDDFLADVEAAT